MEAVLSCPICGKTDINKKYLASIGNLFLGVLLIIISAAAIVFWLFMINDPIASRNNPHNILIVPIFAFPAGVGFVFRYLAFIKKGLLYCTCRACNFKWKQHSPKPGEETMESIRKCLDIKDEKLRIETAETLGKLRDRKSIGSMIMLLDQKFEDKHNAGPRIAKALGKMGEPALDPLLNKLSTLSPLKDKEIRGHIVEALGKIKDPRIIDPLIKELKAAFDERYKNQILEALGKTGDRRAIPYLIEGVITFPNALQYLKNITGEDFGKDPDAWESWWKKNAM